MLYDIGRDLFLLKGKGGKKRKGYAIENCGTVQNTLNWPFCDPELGIVLSLFFFSFLVSSFPSLDTHH